MSDQLTILSFPVVLAVACLLAEAAALLGLRRAAGGKKPAWPLLVRWSARPWLVWAVFSMVYRLHPDKGFNNVRTFPFFSNLWHSSEGWMDSFVRIATAPAGWIFIPTTLLTLTALCMLARKISRPDSGVKTWETLFAVYLLGLLLMLVIASLPDGPLLKEHGRAGALTRSWQAHTTVLWALPHIRTKSHFLRNFEEIQPRLRGTIHGLSHPPGGALSLYFIGKVIGADHEDYRSHMTRFQYLIGLALFSFLNVFVLYGLGYLLFDDRRTGLTAALLWTAAPSTLAYSYFAQNGLYAVFFCLALLLTWTTVFKSDRPGRWAVPLGLVFYLLTMMNYAWCIATSIFAVFALATGLQRRWRPADILIRAILPLGIMTLLLGATLLYYRLDYLAIYKVSSDYVGQWYRFTSPYKWLAALLGGQIDMWLMMGSATCSFFLAGAGAALRRKPLKPATVFLLIILCVFALPLVFGPNPLKMETARCWNWILAVPLAFAANRIMQMEKAEMLLPAVTAVSGTTYLLMRLYLDFAP